MGGNYSKDMFKQLSETILRVDKLSAEIAMLKTAHRKEIETLKQTINIQAAQIGVLKAENQKLKDIINKNSANSSKPPSTDGFKKIFNSREKSGKKVGGQPGHKGHIPKLYENPTQVIEYKQTECTCGGEINYSDDYKAKQQVDLKIKVNIIEHRSYEGVCSCCGKKNQNVLPVNDTITYGENLKAFASMLSSEGLVSINRTQSMIYELTGGIINLSEGTIAKWNEELSGKLSGFVENLKEKLLTTPLLNKDETGVRINGKLHWFHVLGNKEHTLYFADKKRGCEADEAIGILPIYSGVLVHDHLTGLYSFNCTHAECNAHILRYLKSAAEDKKRAWATKMIELLVEANNFVKECKASGAAATTLNLNEDKIDEYKRRYDKILESGRLEFLQSEEKDYNGEDMKLLRRLGKFKEEHLLFLSDLKVPFDNNQAERDLRMIKSKAKVSGCFRGENGGAVFAKIKSYTSTLRKNSFNIFDGLKKAFFGDPLFGEG